MKWEDVLKMMGKINELRDEANYIRECHDDYGAVPGCDCGCSGDTFDWDGQREAYFEADGIDAQADAILEELRCAWEGRSNVEM